MFWFLFLVLLTVRIMDDRLTWEHTAQFLMGQHTCDAFEKIKIAVSLYDTTMRIFFEYLEMCCIIDKCVLWLAKKKRNTNRFISSWCACNKKKDHWICKRNCVLFLVFPFSYSFYCCAYTSNTWLLRLIFRKESIFITYFWFWSRHQSCVPHVRICIYIYISYSHRWVSFS